jgi:hypothetical protein
MSEQVSSGDDVLGTADGPLEVPGHADRGFDWPVAVVLLSSIALAYLVLLSAIYVVLAALL